MVMRDPERIDEIIEELRAAWKKMPDMRLGQLVSVAAWIGNNRKYGDDETFSIEDDKMLEGIKHWKEV